MQRACGVALVASLLLACVAGQGFGGGNNGATTATPGTTATGATTTSASTSTVAPTTSTAPPTTTTARPTTAATSTAAPTTAPPTAPPTSSLPLFGGATLGRTNESLSCAPVAQPTCTQTSVVFSYTDLFQDAKGSYCCPHRPSCAYINGTGRDGVWYAGDGSTVPRTDPNQAYYPQTVIGNAVLNDSPYALGLWMTVDSALLQRGNIVALWVLSFQNGTCTGAPDSAGKPTCIVADSRLPGNGIGLFATAMVPMDGSQLRLSGFSPVPNAALGLRSTVDTEFQFRLSDHGAPATSGVEAFYRQWSELAYCSSSSCPDRSQYVARFPPRERTSNPVP